MARSDYSAGEHSLPGNWMSNRRTSPAERVRLFVPLSFRVWHGGPTSPEALAGQLRRRQLEVLAAPRKMRQAVAQLQPVKLPSRELQGALAVGQVLDAHPVMPDGSVVIMP